MTHFGPVPESSGTFTQTTIALRECAKCSKVTEHDAACWESNDGAYEDWKYTCRVCGAVHWVDGIDS